MRFIVTTTNYGEVDTVEKKYRNKTIWYEKSYEYLCPYISRDRTRKHIMEMAREFGNNSSLLNKIIFEDGAFSYDKDNHRGTSTRIEDYRIAFAVLVEQGKHKENVNLDIYDTISTERVQFYGRINMGLIIVYLWGANTKKNKDRDIIGNAKRIIDRLNEG